MGKQAPGERWIRVGAMVFLVGVVMLGGAVLPFLLGRDNPPLLLALAAFMAPVGLGVALVGMLLGARDSQRRLR